MIRSILSLSVTRRSVKLTCAALGIALPVSAQSFSSARLVIDNDFIAIRDGGAQDQDYSSGVRIDLAWRTGRRAPVGQTAQTFPGIGACCQFGLSLGQELYTPSRDGTEPVPGERAYAAWLFLEPSYLWRAARYTNVVALRVGWIGPPALGEQTQNSVHQLIRSEQHVGWRNQARIGPAYLSPTVSRGSRHYAGIRPLWSCSRALASQQATWKRPSKLAAKHGSRRDMRIILRFLLRGSSTRCSQRKDSGSCATPCSGSILKVRPRQ
jgi:hypothetical protein